MRRFLQLFLPIRIHGWGGFGSQVFMLLTAERMSRAFPGRKITLVFHTSGVTHRVKEISSHLIVNYNILEVDDFKSGVDLLRSPSNSSSKQSLRHQVVILLEKFGFVSRLNNDEDYQKIFPWLISIRGHYSYITLSQEELDFLMHFFGIASPNVSGEKRKLLSVHYRLGDLLSLYSKTYVEVERVADQIVAFTNIDSCEIFSDSDEKTLRTIFQGHLPHQKTTYLNTEPFQVVKRCVESAFFIGTNSKISLIIALLRCHAGRGQDTLVIQEMTNQIDILLGKTPSIAKYQSY